MSKKYWRIMLAVLLVGLLAFGGAMVGLAENEDPPAPDYPTNCPTPDPVLPDDDWFTSPTSYPDLGAGDPKPDQLPLLDECDEYGYLKVNYGSEEKEDEPKLPDEGWYYADMDDDEVTGTDDGFMVYIWNNGDGTFTWVSNYPVTYVYAKGGPLGGNMYIYQPPSTCGTNLAQPGGGAFSHINFYYCVPQLEVEASITAEAIWEIEYEWDIEKTVDVDEHHLFFGQSATSNYTITATRATVSETTDITGEACVENTGTLVAEDVTLTVILYEDNGITPVGDPVVFDDIGNLNPEEDACREFSFENVGFAEGDKFIVSVTASASNEDLTTSDTASTEVEPVLELADGSDPAEVDLSDSYEGDYNGAISSTTTWEYSRDFDCEDECDYTTEEGGCAFDNTATISRDDFSKSDDATVVIWCYELEVDVEADYTWTREYDWEIEKDVDVDFWQIFKGDTATSEYTITVTKSLSEEVSTISGDACVSNPAPMDATGVTLTVSLFKVVDNGDDEFIDSQVVLDDVTVDAAVNGTPGEECDGFEFTDVEFEEGAEYYVVASVEFDLGDNPEDADDAVGPVAPQDINDEIIVDDTYLYAEGMPWEFSDSGSVSYSRTFDCVDLCNVEDGSCTFDNTASIRDTDKSDDASVTVECYELVVNKTADTTFTRTYEWDIVKVGDEAGPLYLSSGQTYDINYTVTVSADFVDSDWAVSGVITIENTHPTRDAVIVSITDLLCAEAITLYDEDDNALEPEDFPLTIGPEETLTLKYAEDLDDAEGCDNVVSVVQQNYDYSYDSVLDDEVAGVGGTTPYSDTAAVSFDLDNPTTEVDKCVDVYDDGGVPNDDPTDGDYLGSVCYGDNPEDFIFTYTLTITADATPCQWQEFINTACFVTEDLGIEGCDDWTVEWKIPEDGCTLTPGYWKTHSIYGPAPYDDTWALLGEDTPFFESGQTYYEVLWTPPVGGNAYYILAHAYIAAELNKLNDADFTAAQDAFNAATALFNSYGSADDFEGLRGRQAAQVRAEFIELASILDDYNNGLIGPGHCDEDGNSAD